MRNVVRGIAVLAGAGFRADAPRAVLVLALAPAVGCVGALSGLGVQWAVDAAAQGDPSGALVAAALLIATVLITHQVGVFTANLRIHLQQRVALLLDQRMMRMCADLPGLEHHELPAYLDEMELLRDSRDELGGAFGSIVENLRTVTTFGATLGLLATLHPLLLLLPFLAIPAVLTGYLGERASIRVSRETAEPERLRDALFRMAGDARSAKELRIYGLGGELTGRHDALHRDIHRAQRRVEVRTTTWSTASWAVFGLGFLGAVALILARALQGEASAGDVALAITLASQLEGNVSGLVQMFGWMQRSLRAASHYLWLVDHVREARKTAPAVTAQTPFGMHELVLDNVGFTYPGTDRPILRDVCLRVPAGSTIAIVGENGAGKSTLVKLLGRMYEPTTGRILLDRTDLRRFDVGEWRSRLAAGFQDFCRFELLARETVGIGDLPRIDDPNAVGTAVDRAGAAELPAKLPAGLGTQLGRTFPDGTDLSAGQWQKLAMGRAMMRDEPLLLLLDEPTANLDPATEHALFERYAIAARRTGSGTITVFVSHRFSTVRMADVIVVLDEGRIREVGTHGELMSNGDLYATLYGLHARGYRRASTPKESTPACSATP
jgi:ATP-binding cassette subfamily B protein